MRIGPKDRFSVLLVIAGLAVLGSAVVVPRTDPVMALEREEDLPVDVSRLLAGRETGTAVGDAALAVVFLLRAEVCPPCLYEVGEYARLARQLGVAVEPLVLVLEDDPHEVARFSALAELPLVVRQGRATELSRLLQAADRELIQQMLWLDLTANRLFYRAVLLNRPSEESYKREVLQRVLAAHLRHHPTPG